MKNIIDNIYEDEENYYEVIDNEVKEICKHNIFERLNNYFENEYREIEVKIDNEKQTKKFLKRNSEKQIKKHLNLK